MIRKAILTDVDRIAGLVDSFATQGNMLPRPKSEIYSNIRSFYVFEEGGEVVGTCALHICLDGLGEVRSLAVTEGHTGQGVGRALVEASISEAKAIGLSKVFALTYSHDFFQRLGFSVTDKETLPHKIWTECIKCSKFPNCDETAVILEL